jgi:hypothetical protein
MLKQGRLANACVTLDHDRVPVPGAGACDGLLKRL